MLAVLCFGNPHLTGDSMALEVGRALGRGIAGAEFVECGLDVGFLDEYAGRDFLVLDVVKGITEVRFVSPGELRTVRTATAHDLDVGFYIRLLEKEGKHVRVLGIPDGMDKKEASSQVLKALVQLLEASR